MPPVRDQGHLVRELREVTAELDLVARQTQGVGARVQATIGSSATGADRRMLAALGQVSASVRGAQQALSAAAGGLQRLR